MGVYEIATQRLPYHLNCLHINTLHHAIYTLYYINRNFIKRAYYQCYDNVLILLRDVQSKSFFTVPTM